MTYSSARGHALRLSEMAVYWGAYECHVPIGPYIGKSHLSTLMSDFLALTGLKT